MLLNNTKTSFKISGLVGIIILFLGIAILFGVYQMSKVSQEIIEISEEYGPLNEIVTDIRYHKLSQATNFEKVLRFHDSEDISNLEKAKEEFWFSSELIDSDIARGKNIAQTGLEMSISDNASSGFLDLHQKLTIIENVHGDYENLVSEAFRTLNENDKGTNDQLLEQIKQKEKQIQDEIDSILSSLAIFTDESTNRIEENERDSMVGQIIIITIVGAIAATLGLFISRINRDLKNEVDLKTVELKSANEKLKELDQMKDEFIGIASHELKSPIQPIFGYAELAKAGDIDQKEAWDGVTHLATKLQDLANAVLDVSRIESNRLKLQLEKVPINDVILENIELLKINLREGVVIKENLDKNIEIEVDKVRFAQVLRNILNNAIKFTRKGTINIETQVNLAENKIQVKISDSGLGIPEEILPKVFEKFVTKSQKNENQSGTGLGLFLCNGIINAHGGEIAAYNNAEGGATLEFTLPILQKPTIQMHTELFRK